MLFKKTNVFNEYKVVDYSDQNINSIDSHHLNSHATTTTRTMCHLDSKMLVICLLVIIFELCTKPCLVLASSLHVSANNKLSPLFWLTNNKKFYETTSDNYYLKLNAHIGDSIDLVCPKYQKNNDSGLDQTETNQAHYLTIYKVGSKYEFDNCIINPNNIETVPILKCDKPMMNTKFTIYFVKYSPVPFALEFEEDKEYFFLSTSSGNKEGLNFMTGGLCSKFNMRFSIKINSADSVPQVNATLLNSNKKSEQNSVSTSQLLTDEDNIILQQLRERIQSTVSSMNHLVHRNDKESPQAQSSKQSNLVLISKSNNLHSNQIFIYFLLMICYFIMTNL